ncbi:MAG TPA: LLM class flavin-dependent oxidoreductase, partial [Ktedonobacteraceae bacterium]|nr:LLM class flavin-dependent oxidoreductase [Ktedonobacteraceae bacterium]
RIPIWVGGSSQKRGPVQRAARWDGFLPVPIPLQEGGRHLRSEEVQVLKATIKAQRSSSAPFDLALGGLERGTDWERERSLIKALEEAGATWWMEGIPLSETQGMRKAIERGPLRID